MKIRRLAGHPRHELRQTVIGQQQGTVSADAGKLAICKTSVNGLMADRVKLHGGPAAASARHRMMQFHLAAQWPGAQPARACCVIVGHAPG